MLAHPRARPAPCAPLQARRAAELLRTRWGVAEPPYGVPSVELPRAATAGMAAVALPAPLELPAAAEADAADARAAAGAPRRVPATPEGAALLQRHLRSAHRMEVPVAAVEGRLYVRVSAQVYNSLEQYGRLADAVFALRPRGCSGGGGGGGGGGGRGPAAAE
jgi:hypothetical protein